MTPRPVAILTDFGLRDPSVGICHGVILSADPTIPIIDITHSVERQDVRAGSLALAEAAPFMPAGCVFAAIVDPGVGSSRRALAVGTGDGSIFVGPDNGLLIPALGLRGGAVSAFEISRSPWRLEPVSATFHGRDLFAPVAAKLACGESLAEAGERIDHTELAADHTSGHDATHWEGESLVTAVLDIDQFGNVRLAARASDLDEIDEDRRIAIVAGERRQEAIAANSYAYGGADDLLLIEDSAGWLSLAVNRADASRALGIAVGERVELIPQ